jgi:hypothetical protein
MGLNRNTRPMSLLHNDSFELLNAELNDKQFTHKQII